MKCPECKEKSLKIVHTDKSYQTINIRYLKCDICGTTFQSKEEIIKSTIVEKLKSLFDGECKDAKKSK